MNNDVQPTGPTRPGLSVLRKVSVALVALWAFEALFMALLVPPPHNWRGPSARLVVTGLFALGLSTGGRFARWLAIALYGPFGLVALWAATKVVEVPLVSLFGSILGVGYLACAGVLAASPSVRAFFDDGI